VVTLIFDQLGYIGEHLVSAEQLPAYRAWLASYLRPIVNDIGWTPKTGEPDERKRMRGGLLEVLGFVARDEETLRRARELTDLALKDPTAVDPNLLDVVVPLAALNGEAALFAQFVEARAKAKSPSEYYRYLYGLLSFEDPELQAKAFAMTLSPEMRNQDLPGYVGAMLEKEERQTAAWAFLKSNWSDLRKNFTPWGGANIVRATGRLCDARQREDVQQFFAANPVPASERSLAQALEGINLCVEFRTLQAKNVTSWLANGAHSK